MGYNNTRLNDVKKLELLARRQHDADLVLCKSGLTGVDRDAVRLCIESDLRPTEDNVRDITQFLVARSLTPLGVLPFSDSGVELGALLATALSMPAGRPDAVGAAADKFSYRQAEARVNNRYPFLRAVRAAEIFSPEDIRRFEEEISPSAVFLKPRAEGNSRGCLKLEPGTDPHQAFDRLSGYLSGGILAEECIERADEYSVDHVGGYSWVTEKKTTEGLYRAEIQQIVPAPLDPAVESRISQSGFAAAEVCGFEGGAFHNEVFLLKNSAQTAVVEPNLRPAGMKIWDLAALAFEGFDPWTEWLRACQKKHEGPKVLRPTAYAGIRMVRSRTDGVLTSVPRVEDITRNFPAVVEVNFSKRAGDRVTATVANNADYVASVVCATPSYAETQEVLMDCTSRIERELGVE